MMKGKISQVLFIACMLIAVLWVWLPAIFLTGDGACAVYNAQLLHDLWQGKMSGFYEQFYVSLNEPNPNWLSHLIMAGCMYMVTGIVAEKILLSLYIVLYASGFYLLLNQIIKRPSLLYLGVFIPLFNQTLGKGFYNFALGTGLYFYVIYYWIKFLNLRSKGNTGMFFLMSTLLFFAHLMGFLLSLITCGILILSIGLSGEYEGKQFRLPFIAKAGISLVVLSAPWLMLTFWFTQHIGGLQMLLGFHPYRVVELFQLKYLQFGWGEEQIFLALTGLGFMAMLGFALYQRIRQGKAFRGHDGFGYAFVLLLIAYIVLPEAFMGRMILISMRAQIFLFMVGFAFIAANIAPRWANGLGIFMGLNFLMLMGIRYPRMLHAARVAKDIVSLAPYIQPGSVVLPLNFAPTGIDAQGNVVTEYNTLFKHTSDYLGTYKPLVMLDNYAANTGYFPMLWVYGNNPYAHLSIGKGHESSPPELDMEHYEQKTGKQIRYIMVTGYREAKDSAFMSTPTGKYMLAQYRQIASLNGQSIQLYERK